MLAVTLDGYSLVAFLGIILGVIVLALIAARLLRDHGVRVVRIGVFIDRRRITASDQDAELLPLVEAVEVEEVEDVEPTSAETQTWPRRPDDVP